MTRRLLDLVASAAGLLILSPLLAVILLLVWRQDGKSPFYVADRVGAGGRTFRMVKVRSMVINADRSGVESTGAHDARITPLGGFIRRWKVDELGQLWNVLLGQMSLVGPRPNTMREVALYSPEERRLLDVRPGITDLSSIVFSDEGDILAGKPDPDGAYRELIWPWKSQLGLLYVHNKSLRLNLELITLTVVAIADKQRALTGVDRILRRFRAPEALIEASSRRLSLEALAADMRGTTGMSA